MKKVLALVIPSLLLTACTSPAPRHHHDVRPSMSGTHSIVFLVADKTSGYNWAKPQIDFFCEKQGKVAYINTENFKYTGSMDESEYLAIQAAANVAKGIGAAPFWTFNQNDAGRSGVLGQVAGDALGPGYTYTMTFQCH